MGDGMGSSPGPGQQALALNSGRVAGRWTRTGYSSEKQRRRGWTVPSSTGKRGHGTAAAAQEDVSQTQADDFSQKNGAKGAPAPSARRRTTRSERVTQWAGQSPRWLENARDEEADARMRSGAGAPALVSTRPRRCSSPSRQRGGRRRRHPRRRAGAGRGGWPRRARGNGA